MKLLKLLSLLMIIGLVFSACKEDGPIEVVHAKTIKFTNLYAPADVRDHQTGEITEENEFVYFDFSSGETVEKTADWDIAFKGTKIIVNGGFNGTGNVSAALLLATFDEVTEAPAASEFSQDTELSTAITSGSGNGWYEYNPANHLITPIAGRIIVVKTTEGNYAKMEILSYYENAPANPDPATDQQDTYTFNYAYQGNGTTKF